MPGLSGGRLSGCNPLSRPPRALLTSLLALHLLLGLAVNFVTPPFEGPDEPNHFLFIRHLQANGWALPVQGTERDAVRAHHPPGYFWLGALLTAWAPDPSGEWSSLGLTTNPRYDFRFDDPNPENKLIFLHTRAEERWPYAGVARVLHVARLLSLAFSTVGVALTYVAARQLRPADEALALLAAGLVAFNPMVVYMAGVVQNDAAALAAGASVLAALGWALRRRASAWSWVVVGVVWGTSILLKAGLLALGAVIGLALAYQAGAEPRWRERIGAFVRSGLAVGVPAALLAGWWLWRNQQLYGDWTGNASIVALWGPLTPEQQRAFLPLALYTLSTGLVGRFSNGGILDFPRPVYAVAGLLALLMLAGLAKAVARARPSLRRLSPTAVLWGLHGLTVLVVLASVFTFALTFNGGATGKYLFPAFPSLAVLLGAGALAWARPEGRHWVAGGVLALCFAASIYAITGVLRPAYGWPRAPWPGEVARAVPVDADLSGAVRVLGYGADRSEVAAGETVRVTVYWLPTDVTPVPYTAFLHLVSPSAGLVAQRDRYPGAGGVATNLWPAGRAFVDTFYLTVPGDAPAGEAVLMLGLYDEATGERLIASGANADPAGSNAVLLGSMNVVAAGP